MTKTCEHSGVEIPEKCCENCEFRRGLQCLLKIDHFTNWFVQYHGKGYKWDIKTDSCTRHEFKEETK